jgi:putative flavoprotein involved in K+ transport
MTSDRAERFDTVIIGAGQAGLSVGYHLARRCLPLVVLDANERVGDSWRKRWDSLRLFSPASLDGLPGMPFPGAAWSFPTKDETADFIEAYARRFSLPVRTRVGVDRLSREDGRYVLTAGDDRFEADNVVVATGAYRNPRIPAFAPDLDPGILQMHSSEYRNPAQLRSGGVLVVGAGNSGAEIALEAARAGHQTWLSGRDTGRESPFRHGSTPDRLLVPVAWFVASRVLTANRPPGRALRRRVLSMGLPLARIWPADLAAAGIERVAKTVGVTDGDPVLDGGRVMDVANVVWCIGFRPDFSWIDLPVFGAEGAVAHERGVVASHPGLYLVGENFLHSLTSSLIGGVGRDAEYIARHIASHRTSGGRRRAPPALSESSAISQESDA